MRTDELADLLSTGIVPVKSGASARRFGIALPIAGISAALLMWMIFGIRPDIMSVGRTALFWGKIAFPLCISGGALIVTARLARPGVRAGGGFAVIAAPIFFVWLAGLLVVATVAPQDRLPELLGHSWKVCPLNIVLLSIPGFAAIFWAVRGLAPTRLALAGAASGLLASSIGTVAYCLHCPEMSPAFWGVWYLLGMLLPAAVGAVLGPLLLRW
jgi:hypothetical protein